MEIFELLLMIFRTIILSTIYSTIILLLIILIAKYSGNNWANKKVKRKFRFWLTTHFVVSVFLFFGSLFYFHDTGIGDVSIIPIGFGQSIQNADFQTTYFYPDLRKTDPNKDAIVITNYIITENKICAEVSHEFTESPKYNFFVYDLSIKKMTTFDNEIEYTKFAKRNNLPIKTKFYSFEKHFYEYLNAKPFWKTWLVP